MTIVLRILVNAAALWAAARLFDGITLSSEWVSILIVAVIFGLVNAIIKPITKLLTFPITIVTLGLFTLVINALMLQLTDALTDRLTVDGFWTSVFGGLVISLVSWALSAFLPDEDRRDRRREHDNG